MSHDAAMDLMLAEINRRSAPMLWCCDEQWGGDSLAQSAVPLHVLSHRCDTASALNEQSLKVELGDYDFEALDFHFETVAYRISKEKALVHHIIKQSLKRLPVGGELLLSGFKNEGFKTYVDKARALVGAPKQISKGRGGAMLARIKKQFEPAQSDIDALKDDDYTQCRKIAVNGFEFYSKPGVYGWQKVDRGSALLIDAVAQGERDSAPAQVLDLGCGYGYLTLAGARLWPSARWVSTDNNAAAINACSENMKQYAIAGECLLADCAQGIDEQFDWVLCNPPFHRGFDHDQSLTRTFIRTAAQRLQPKGCAWFVVNQFIALPAIAADYFSSVELKAEADGYRIFRLSN